MIRFGRTVFILPGLLSCIFLAQVAWAQTYTIQSLVGGGSPISGPAQSTDIGLVHGMALDRAGNIYASLPLYNLVVKIDPSGNLTRFAGNGTLGYTGDGGPASSAQLNNPSAIAIDAKGDVFINQVGDFLGNDRAIRRVDASTGIITTMTGQAEDWQAGMTVAPSGDVYFVSAWQVLKVDAGTGIITSVAGNGEQSNCYADGHGDGDGGPATSAALTTWPQLAVDASGNLYITGCNRLRRVDAVTGTITTIAGLGTGGPGDGVPASQATFDGLMGIAVDRLGNIFIADTDRTRKIDAVTGIITSLPNSIGLNVSFIAVDAAGNLGFGDSTTIRRMNAAGSITTVAGNYLNHGGGDGGPAAGAELFQPYGVAVDPRGNVYIAETGNHRIRKVDASTGIITTVAGNGTAGFGGDNGPGPAAELNYPMGLVIDAGGNLYIADMENSRIRRLDAATGTITTVAGNGTNGQTGDGGLAINAQVATPQALAFDSHGDFYLSGYQAVRKITISNGKISTVVPYGLTAVVALAIDGAGNVLISDEGAGIWKANAGTGALTLAFPGVEPSGMVMDGAGGMYITWGCGVERMDPTGVMTPIAGACSSFGNTPLGDGGPALLAGFNSPSAIALGPGGTLYVADSAWNNVRVLTPSDGSGGCSFQVSPTNFTSSTSATNLLVSIQSALSGCFWSVTSQPGWITPIPYSGFGSRTLTLAVAANTGPAQSASFQVAGIPVQASQAGSCAWSLSPPSRTFPAEGGWLTIGITGCPGLSWTATPLASDWFSNTGRANGTGDGSVTYVVQRNTGDARSTTLTIAGLSFNLQQTAAGTAAPGLRFFAVTPCRIADTRNPDGPLGGPTLAGGAKRSFPVLQGACGIPASAQAYSLNVTVVPKGMLPYLTLWPSDQTQPLVSTLNSFDGEVVANAAIVPAGADGSVSVFAAGATDVILDINGYFDPSDYTAPCSGCGSPVPNWFYPVTPCRAADTRTAVGPFGGPSLLPYETRYFDLWNTCGISNMAATSLNVTAVPGTSYLGYLTIWPFGQDRPNASTLNSWEGKIVANAAIVPGQTVNVLVTDPTNLILDVNGYFAPGLPGTPGAMSFYPVTPCRVADTRGSAAPIMQARERRSFPIPASGCGVPATAGAYALNVTVVPDGPLSYVTTWPTGSAQPFASTLNSFDGSVVANAAIVPAGTDGAISVYVTDRTHVIIDINGYFAP